jgi:hypothetical protein
MAAAAIPRVGARLQDAQDLIVTHGSHAGGAVGGLTDKDLQSVAGECLGGRTDSKQLIKKHATSIGGCS